MTELDRDDLDAAWWALRTVTHILAARNEPTTAFDCALTHIEATIAANGNPKSPRGQTEWNDWVSVGEAARLLGCSERRVRQIAPAIGAVKRAGAWWIPRSALPEPGGGLDV